jgi:hypothetical protein
MTETAQTIKDVTETLAPYLDKLADSIGNNGSYVFELMVKQVYVDAAVSLLDILFCFGMILFMIKVGSMIWKYGNKTTENSYQTWFEQHDDISMVLVGIEVICFIFSLMLLIMGFSNIEKLIKLLANPEYQAIIQLLHAVK